MQNRFISIDSVVSSILLEIGDESNKRYKLRARQWALEEYRRINMFLSDFYLERKTPIDEINSGDIPEDCVKLLAVGIYRNGKFVPFVKVYDMSINPEDTEDGIYDSSTKLQDNASVRVKSSAVNANGYWMEDKEHSRFFVRNYRKQEDTTSNIRDRVVIRYRTTGLDLGGDIQIPIEARDYIVAEVTNKFMGKGIPVRPTNDEKMRQQWKSDEYKEAYLSLIYEPSSFFEVKDALYSNS